MKKKRPAKKASTMARDMHLQVVAQFSQDGHPLGEPVIMAKAKLLYIGSDDREGAQYVFGIIRPLRTEPTAFSEEGMNLLYSDDAAVEHVLGLAGKEIRWGGAANLRKGAVVRGVDGKKRRAGKAKRGKS